MEVRVCFRVHLVEVRVCFRVYLVEARVCFADHVLHVAAAPAWLRDQTMNSFNILGDGMAPPALPTWWWTDVKRREPLQVHAAIFPSLQPPF